MNTSQLPDLPPDVMAALQRATMPDFPRWQQMVTATGGCAQPIRLKGERVTLDAETGEVIESYATADEPTGYLLTACGNRRASRCPACAEVYRDDTYHLIIAGMQGGKGVPEGVSRHPRVFATLTAPSFGAVHTRRERAGKALPCRPRRNSPVCVHGRPEGCGQRHEADASTLGQPICGDCYDYVGAVLWNARAAELWRRFMLALPKRLAASLGITRKAFREQARVSYARVIEYQRRGLVHFHAVIRIDGPDGPTDAPPAWATTDLLTQAIHEAAEDVTVSVPAPDGDGSLSLVWGTKQLDVQPVYVAAELDGVTTDKNVARYIAKYATKGAEASGTVDRPIRYLHQVQALDIDEHARRMIWTCLQLAEFPQYVDLRLRQWAHMLGYGGHFSTKSRHYSTTLGALRQERADYQEAQARAHGEGEPTEQRRTLTLAQWSYAGSGYLHGEGYWAEAIRERVQTARSIRRQATERDRDQKAS
ncbi:replication initiator [Actinoallomurus soli]|uniref:replication initiator n=1 Tax=Actinoallomurus soli TaxID=2952535 RepID=UPI0020926B6A|nr:replication initiator [Actinoallomurus soli]MCO5968528.1 replication initiation protein [Actinoallomurus soli]